MARSVGRQTLGFASVNLDLVGHEMEPCSATRLHAHRGVCLTILSLSSFPDSPVLSLYLDSINKCLLKNVIPRY